MLTLTGTRHFTILNGTRGGRGDPSLRVTILIVVKIRRKDQRIAIDEYSRSVVHFLTLGQNLPIHGRSKFKFS